MITPRGLDGPDDRRRGLKLPFVAAALFFTVAPLVSLLANPPGSPAALALLLLGWAIFAVVLAALLRGSPFERTEPQPMLAVAIAAIAGIALVVQVVFHVDHGVVLYFYAGATAARLPARPARWPSGPSARSRAGPQWLPRRST